MSRNTVLAWRARFDAQRLSLDKVHQLFLVDLHLPGVALRPGSWPAVGMDGSDSLDVDFQEVSSEVVGGAGFHLAGQVSGPEP